MDATPDIPNPYVTPATIPEMAACDAKYWGPWEPPQEPKGEMSIDQIATALKNIEGRSRSFMFANWYTRGSLLIIARTTITTDANLADILKKYDLGACCEIQNWRRPASGYELKSAKDRPYAAIFRAFSAFRTESRCSFRML